MIQSLTFTNRFGRSLRCILGEPERSGFAITSVSGLGPGNSSVNIHDIATADGGFFGSARFSSRQIQITFRLQDFDLDGRYVPIEETRLLSYEFFAPKTKLQIVAETDRRTLAIEGYVETNEPDIFQSDEAIQVSILCPGYYFKMISDNGSAQSTVIYGGGLFEFPFSNESINGTKLIQFGEVEQIQKYEMYYDGDAENGFVLDIAFKGETVNTISIQNNPLGNSEKGPVGFLSPQDAVRVEYNWNDISNLSKIITVNMTTVARKLGSRYSSPVYGVGNHIIISSTVGNKYAVFVDANNNYYNILDAFAHLDWLKLYPGYNEFTVTTDVSSIGHVTITADYEALYVGV